MLLDLNDLFEDDADMARRLEEIFAEHRKELPPDLLLQIASLKEGKCGRVWVIDSAMEMVHEGEEVTRQEILFALDLTIEYLSATAQWKRGPHGPLSKLREAIFELERGIFDPVLRPNKPSNRVQDSLFMRAQKMMAAAACEALIQLNVGREKSASLIAGLLNKIGFPPSGRRATATAVLYWRQKFSGELDFEVNRDFFRAMAWSNAHDPTLLVDKRRLREAVTYVKCNKHRFPRLSDELDFIAKQASACPDGHRPGLAVDKKRVLEALSDLMSNKLRFPGWTEGAFFMKNGKLYRRWEGHGYEHTFSAEDHDRLGRLIQIRDTVSELLLAQVTGKPTAEKDALRKKLNTAWKAFVKEHGPINREVRTVTNRLNNQGEPIVITKLPNFDKFKGDPDAFKVAAIENYDRETDKAEPSEIQFKDVIGPFASRIGAER
jgi:hypothetical protein